MSTTDYPLAVKHKVDTYTKTYDTKSYLTKLQYVVKEYFINRDIRGLLLFHSPGVGKTITAAAVAEYIRKYDSSRTIIVLLSKSLQENFKSGVKKYIRNTTRESDADVDTILNTKYKFISMNASNMFDQLTRIKQREDVDEFERQVGNFTTNVRKLDNTLLIVDEFHNLSNSITNHSKNAIQLYELIMNTRNMKLLFMTGTPIINSPFELVPTFNMLKGYLQNGKQMVTLFPENYEDFANFFIKHDDDGMHIKNKDRFQNRIFGMVSYYGDYYFDKRGKQDFPTQLPVIVERVHMSAVQFERYSAAREIEHKEEESRAFSKGTQGTSFRVTDINKGSSSYRIRSRQVSNYCIPKGAITYVSQVSIQKNISAISNAELADLNTYSPKFAKILENIGKHTNQLGIVYSEFVTGEGIGVFTRVLEHKGYKDWMTIKKSISDMADFIDGGDASTLLSDALESGILSVPQTGNVHKMSLVYAVITGEIPVEQRQMIVNVFNTKHNQHGANISLLLLSKSGAEGLSLQNVRHIHIMEPFWNYARIEQVIGRGVRYKSHLTLPEEERNVQPYIYISTYPMGYDKALIKEKTTDEELLQSALDGKHLREEFEMALVEASIDCSNNYDTLEDTIKRKFKCKLCAPTGEQLFDVSLYKDVAMPNPCKDITTTQTNTLKEIKLMADGVEQTFYYTVDGAKIKVYAHSSDLGGLVPMKASYPFYSDIVRKVMAEMP